MDNLMLGWLVRQLDEERQETSSQDSKEGVAANERNKEN